MGMYAARSVAARSPPGEDEAASWVEIQLMAAEGTALAGSDDEDDDEAAAATEADDIGGGNGCCAALADSMLYARTLPP